MQQELLLRGSKINHAIPNQNPGPVYTSTTFREVVNQQQPGRRKSIIARNKPEAKTCATTTQHVLVYPVSQCTVVVFLLAAFCKRNDVTPYKTMVGNSSAAFAVTAFIPFDVF